MSEYPDLAGKRVLIVEDDMLISMVLEDMLAEAGMIVAGTAQTVDQGKILAGSTGLDGAILDANLDGQSSEAVAFALGERGVPYIFATGYAAPELEQRHPGAPILHKPYQYEELLSVLTRLFKA